MTHISPFNAVKLRLPVSFVPICCHLLLQSPSLLFVALLSFSCYLIIINVTQILMFRNYSFNFGRNVTKCGRNMERRRERNIAEPKFELKSFRPSSCVFYGRGHI